MRNEGEKDVLVVIEAQDVFLRLLFLTMILNLDRVFTDLTIIF